MVLVGLVMVSMSGIDDRPAEGVKRVSEISSSSDQAKEVG